MSTTVYIVDGPLGEVPPVWEHGPGNGGFFIFEGIVRPVEDGVELKGLDYEIYEGMAEKQLQALGDAMIEKHGLIGMCVEHSKGFVGNGERSFRLRIASYHRKEGIAAMDEFIDTMKKDVPIWKKIIQA